MASDGGAWAMDPDTAFRTNFVPQGIGADPIATIGGWSRTDVDAFAAASHARAAKAHANGYFAGRRRAQRVRARRGLEIALACHASHRPSGCSRWSRGAELLT
jgi:acetyl-CoA C-acetyltransferase